MNDKNIWQEALLLWKTLSEMPDTYTIKDQTSFKNNILRRLNIGTRQSGCPFCEVYTGSENCPLGDCCGYVPCMDSPYREWSSSIRCINMHSQKAAKDFYEYLLKQYCTDYIDL